MIFKFNARGNRRLKESRFGLVVDHEPPGLVVRETGRQTAKKSPHLSSSSGNRESRALWARNGQLHKKHMPSGHLMRPKGWKAIDLVARQGGKNTGQGKRAVRRGANERLRK